MTEQEYQYKLNEMRDKHRKEENGLHWDYAMSNKIADRGDLVLDQVGWVRVEGFGVGLAWNNLPEVIYKGELLTKKLESRKRKEYHDAYQSNIKEVRKNEK